MPLFRTAVLSDEYHPFHRVGGARLMQAVADELRYQGHTWDGRYETLESMRRRLQFDRGDGSGDNHSRGIKG